MKKLKMKLSRLEKEDYALLVVSIVFSATLFAIAIWSKNELIITKFPDQILVNLLVALSFLAGSGIIIYGISEFWKAFSALGTRTGRKKRSKLKYRCPDCKEKAKNKKRC